jgi:predicted phage gp36 major capsid-like protein
MDEKLERLVTELADEIDRRERELNELRERLGALSGVPAQSKSTAGSEAAKRTWAERKAKFEEYQKTHPGVTFEQWRKSLKTSKGHKAGAK